MRISPVLLGVVLTGAACHRPAPRAVAIPTVTVTATDFAFRGPDTILAGTTTLQLVNEGKELHHASLVRLSDGKTQFVGGPNTASPGDTASATVTLEPGSYVVVCWIPSGDGVPHVMKGMMHSLIVTGAPLAADAPPADVTIRLTDYAYELSRPLTAGRQVVQVENTGLQPHEIAIAALLPGKTLRDFFAWEAGGEKGPLPTGRWLGGVTTLDAGKHAQFTATFAPGDYLVLCFWPDTKDGKPHLMHGMAKQIRVT